MPRRFDCPAFPTGWETVQTKRPPRTYAVKHSTSIPEPTLHTPHAFDLVPLWFLERSFSAFQACQCPPDGICHLLPPNPPTNFAHPHVVKPFAIADCHIQRGQVF